MVLILNTQAKIVDDENWVPSQRAEDIIDDEDDDEEFVDYDEDDSGEEDDLDQYDSILNNDSSLLAAKN